MRHTLFALISAIALAFISIQPVHADETRRERIKSDMLARKPALDGLKAKGTIGEDNKGYLGIVSGKLDDASKKAFDAENADRKTVYAAIAQKQGTTAEAVGKRRAKQIAEQAKPGEYIEYETESALRDYENVPLKDDIHAYFRREVHPHVPEAWINLDNTKIGYEISFNKYFYRHQPLRSLEEVSRDILKLEDESEGLIREILEM